jgi:hypothetical protein
LSVKKSVEQRTKIPCDLQRYIFKGKQLEDDKPLSFYGVMRDSTLRLVLRLRGGLIIKIKMPNGKYFRVGIDNNRTFEDFKKIVELELNIPIEKQLFTSNQNKVNELYFKDFLPTLQRNSKFYFVSEVSGNK